MAKRKPQTIAARIKKTREQRGLSAQEVSERAGLDRSYVGRIERRDSNRLSWYTVTKIAPVLHVTPMWLMTGHDPVEEAKE